MYTWKCTREIHDLWGLYYTILIPINDSMQYTSDCMVSLVYIDQKKKKNMVSLVYLLLLIPVSHFN